MDEPTAALGPAKTAQVGEAIKQLKAEGIGIFLINHDLYDVFDLADRVVVMKNGRVVGSARTSNVTHDEALGMIIAGKMPARRQPRTWRDARHLSAKAKNSLGSQTLCTPAAVNQVAELRLRSINGLVVMAECCDRSK